MIDFNSFGIVDREIINSALYSYGHFMLDSGNEVRATKVLEILDRLNSSYETKD